MRRLLTFISLGALLSTAARAEDEPPLTGPAAVCVDDFKQTQALRDEGKLLAARERALGCSQSHCPDIVTAKCKTWLREIDEAIPSVVVTVKDESGRDTVKARLIIDGATAKERLDGRPIALDPGEHVVRVELARRHVQQRVVLAVGQKSRRIELSFAPAPSKVEDELSIHPLTYVGFALTGAGLVVGAVTGGLSLAKTSKLQDACPNKSCGEDERDLHDEAITMSHVATASFAVAGAGAVLGLVGLLVLSDGVLGAEAMVTPLLGPGRIGLRGRF